MNEGDVVLTPIQQADGAAKNRPAIVLRKMPGFNDLLVCGVSTQLRHEVRGFDELIVPEDDEFSQTGLVRASLIRLGFLAVLPDDRILGKIGAVSSARHRRLLEKLSTFLISTTDGDEIDLI